MQWHQPRFRLLRPVPARCDEYGFPKYGWLKSSMDNLCIDRLKFNSWACFIVHGWGGEGISASKLVEGGKSIGRRRQLFRQLVRRCSLSCTRWAACGVLLLYGSPKYGILKQKDGRGAYWVFEMQYIISVVEGFCLNFCMVYGLWFLDQEAWTSP